MKVSPIEWIAVAGLGYLVALGLCKLGREARGLALLLALLVVEGGCASGLVQPPGGACPPGTAPVPVPGGTTVCLPHATPPPATPPPSTPPPTTPPPTPPPTTPPAPVACDFPQGVPESEFLEGPNPQTLASVVDATLAELTGCAPRSDCPLGESDPQFYTDIIVGRLRAKGLCAGQHRTGETDQISVAMPTDGCVAANWTWENYQVINVGAKIRKVRWLPGSVMSGWRVPHASCGGPPGPVKPPPSGPPQPACGEPPRPPCGPPTPGACPELTFLKMDVKKLNIGSAVIDVTPQGPDHARCVSIGKNQDKCPLGPEGPNPEDNAERIRCETFYGPYAFLFNHQGSGPDDFGPCDTASCFHQNDNPLSVKVTAPGTVRVIATKTGLVNQVDVTP